MRLSAEQLAARRGGMGSTDVVEALGLAPWEGSGPMRVYAEKRGLLAPEDDAEDERAQALEWGHIQEPVIARWYMQKTGLELFPCGTTWSTEPGEEWLFCTHDYAIHGGGVRKGVEIKHRNSFMSFREGWDDSDPNGIPDSVRAQVTLQMRICRYDEVDICASLGGQPPRVWTIAYDRALSDSLVADGGAFWRDRILAGVAPPVDGTSASRAYLLATYPHETDPILVDADESMNEIAHRRIQAATTCVSSEVEKRRSDDELLALIATHSGARGRVRGAGWQLTWKTDKNGRRTPRFTVKAEQ